MQKSIDSPSGSHLIDKQEFYRGAAVIRIINDPRLRTIMPYEAGFIINDDAYAIIKYSTKAASPWRFTFTAGELNVIDGERDTRTVVVGFVCGGDGICAVSWDDLQDILGETSSWISCRRMFNKRYVVSGSKGDLAFRVPHNRWPDLVFSEEE